MNPLSSIIPLLAETLVHPKTINIRRRFFEILRKIKGQPHKVLFFYRFDDPYSQILLSILSKLTPDYPDISFAIYIINSTADDVTPDRDALKCYSLNDSIAIAPYFDIEFSIKNKPPSEQQIELAHHILLDSDSPITDISKVVKLSQLLWQHRLPDDDKNINAELNKQYTGALSRPAIQKRLQHNHALLRRKGHYNSAMLYYAGEWYWGVDRLPYLLERLNNLNLKSNKSIAHYHFRRTASSSSHSFKSLPKTQALKLFFSFRSPYSYLALGRTIALAKKYQLTLNINIVLPMVMRGLSVPNTKKMYIFKDAAREALSLNIPFGKANDPLGTGVENCIALFYYAKLHQKEQQFILNITQGIWSNGLDTTDLKQLEAVVTISGLNWSEAKQALQGNTWRTIVEKNRQAMVELGLWGVPSFEFDDFHCWGQDRLWLLEEVIKLKA